MDYLALAGKYANNSIHCTYINQNDQDSYSKTVGGISTASSLRNANLTSIPDPISKQVVLNIKVYDVTGRNLYNYTGTQSEFNSYIDQSLKNQTKSIYLVRVNSLDDSYHNNYKIYK